MLGRSYGPLEQTEKTNQLAEKVTLLVVNSVVTYREAHNALELVLDTLETRTRPVIVETLPQDD